MRTQVSLIALLALLMLGCKSNNKETPETETAIETIPEIETVVYDAQGRNQIVIDTLDDGVMLLGHIDAASIKKEPFAEWYATNYEGHPMDSSLVDSIKPLLADVSIKVYMGSWCEDSQREVPALFKILEQASMADNRLSLVALDHDKMTPDSLQVADAIEYVPTIILSKDGQELNRIVEYPQGSLEQDLLTILKGNPYKHTYAD